MTPQFTTPCYVRVDDPEKRKEICEKLHAMGYAMNFLPKTLGFSTKNSVLVNGRPFYGAYREPSCFLQNHRAGLAKLPEMDGWQFIDCGTNTELFLALAGMRSDTYNGQLMVCDETYTDPKMDYSIIEKGAVLMFGDFDEYAKAFYRRATAQEIIEHFKQKGE